MATTKQHLLFFFGLWPSVLLAQNVTSMPAGPAHERGAAVENFPSQQTAQKNWEKSNPPKKSVSAGPTGPDIEPGGKVSQSGRVSGTPLPNPKIETIDYASEAIEQVSPMTPEAIRRFESLILERARAMSDVPGGPFTPKGNRIMPISFEPNAKPQAIDVGLNMGALITFVDRSGTPLIIDGAKSFSYTFDVGILQTAEVKAKGGSTLEVTPKALAGRGNLMVRLAGVINPVLILVRVGDSKEVDSAIQAVVPILTPVRNVLPGDRLEADGGTQTAEMQGFLMGIPPEGAQDVQVRQVGLTTAWMFRGNLYVRTPHTIFSPGWFKRQASVDGTAVYKLPHTSLVRMGVDGREVEAVFDLPYIPPMPQRSN